MQMVAASKLRRAREQSEAATPYASKMNEAVSSLASSVAHNPDAPKLLAGTGNNKNILLILVSGDRGLCGAFNGNIIKAGKKFIADTEAKQQNVKIYSIGKKCGDFFGRYYPEHMSHNIDGLMKKTISFADAEKISTDLISGFENGEFDRCVVIYNHFLSAISQEIIVKSLIPFDGDNELEKAPKSNSLVYDYEPSEQEILTKLLPQNLAVQIYSLLLDSAASEHGARMSAMDNATRNSGEMIKKLTLRYNRGRQAAITTELTEIISGAEAV